MVHQKSSHKTFATTIAWDDFRVDQCKRLLTNSDFRARLSGPTPSYPSEVTLGKLMHPVTFCVSLPPFRNGMTTAHHAAV